jgi:hypothetical protein
LSERLRRDVRHLSRHLWRRLFPPEVALPEGARQRLAALYPTLDLRRVRFHNGLPWFVGRGIDGITLPARLSPRRCRIYIRPRAWRPDTPDGLALLAHEAFHALQMQEAGPGLGQVRPFLILYLACAARNGFFYRGHPMEGDAYAVAGRRHSHFECAVAAGEEPAPVAASGVRFWRKLAASTPGGVLLSPLWLLAWTGAAAAMWVARLAVEALGAAVAAGLWVLGAFSAAPGPEDPR